MRVIVCGGRDYKDTGHVAEVLAYLGVQELAHGNARGADTLAAEWSHEVGVHSVAYPAIWAAACTDECRPGHRRQYRDGGSYCPAAGIHRNQRMLDGFKPDAVVAFAGGRGTADMVRRAEAAGVKVIPG